MLQPQPGARAVASPRGATGWTRPDLAGPRRGPARARTGAGGKQPIRSWSRWPATGQKTPGKGPSPGPRSRPP